MVFCMNKLTLIISILVFLPACAAHKIETPEEQISYQYTSEGWPADVKTAVYTILKTMGEDSKKRVKETPKEKLIMFHHGWGTGIRNSYGLWRGNKSLITSACGEGCHPDDASMVIIEGVWEKLNEKP